MWKPQGSKVGRRRTWGAEGRLSNHCNFPPHYSDSTAQKPIKTKHMKRLVTRAEKHSWNSCRLSGAPHLTLKRWYTRNTFLSRCKLGNLGDRLCKRQISVFWMCHPKHDLTIWLRPNPHHDNTIWQPFTCELNQQVWISGSLSKTPVLFYKTIYCLFIFTHCFKRFILSTFQTLPAKDWRI